jgi:fumarate reductase subunit D
MSFFRRRYGAGPLHLLAHVAAFVIAVYAFAQIFSGGKVVNFVAWFVGAAVLHDLVFFPLYSGLDRLAHHGTRRHLHRHDVPVINYLRVPALISGLLLLIYFPLILGLPDRNYLHATGHPIEGYARNWLLITAALFTGSALLYAIRLRRRARRRPRSNG